MTTAATARRRVAPKTVDELREILSHADRERLSVAIEGGKTLAAMGAGCSCDLSLVTTHIAKLLAHEQHDLTCSAQAGMRVAALNAELGRHGQFVPIDVPLRRKATIGGSLAAGWLGPRRHRYGRSRDFVIGSQVALADGMLANAGGMVVKNVSGYDMSKLYVGSFGTLGVFTKLNFKTLPIAQARRVLVASLPEATRPRAVAKLREISTEPAAAFCVEGFRKNIDGEDGIDGRAIVFIEGSPALIERTTLEIRTSLGRAGVPETVVIDTGSGESFERVLDACIASIGKSSITYRSLGLPSSVEERATWLRDACQRHEIYTDVLFDVMNGDVFLRTSDRTARSFAKKIDACHADVRAIDPRAVIVAGDGSVRADLEPWGLRPEGFERMLDLKKQFDPNGILNPGRFIV